MPRSLVVAVDCDDVLIPTAHRVVEYYNGIYATRMTMDQFYMPPTLETWGVLTIEEVSERIEGIIRTQQHEFVEPFADAITATQKLADHHELHIVTSRPLSLLPLTQKMTETYFPGVFKSITHISSYARLEAGGVRRTKGEVCKELGAHLLIDDHIRHGRDARTSGVEEVILFGDYPWNARERHEDSFKFCLNWDETAREVEHVAAA